ncbi:MAG: carboxypeptidase M32 [Caldilinea sp.]|nr:carboxypeptidase M32 [Caldilinea sp.]
MQQIKGVNVDAQLQEKWKELKARWQEIYDLTGVSALLNWDQTTYMPPAGAAARSRQLALLERLAHERRTDPAIGRLLDELQPWAESGDASAHDAALHREMRKRYDRATRIPASFAAAFAEHVSNSYATWAEARPRNDFAAVRPYLIKTLDLSRQMADFFPGYAHVADPLIDMADEGMTVATIRPLFESLRQALAPLAAAIAERPQVDNSFLHRRYPRQQQLAFGEKIAAAFGYDFTRGRQDETHHPFMTKFSHDDVRITTRVDETDLSNALFSTMHETGHALYEMGIDSAYASTALDNGASAGVHESQSRLWENIIGRSRAFWSHYYPSLRAAFPEQLADVEMESFHRAVNRVTPSLIRTEADEVTYDLHVIIRFGLELDLLEDKLSVDDLPEAWHARYQENLGVCAPDDRDGVLQDVHWYAGTIGGSFQGYTLGNIMASQFYGAALAALPQIEVEIGEGRFDTLHTWLRENIYRHGARYTADELLRRVTGQPLTIEPYLGYLRSKYSDLYGAL